jgi:catechol 2,3-dioxygenase-like lactoylglutathione lyase family enzyme
LLSLATEFRSTSTRLTARSRRSNAFLIGEDDFDQIFGRIRERGLEHWADPGQHRPGEINRNDGGRGVYFEDPDGHLLEIITRPYGSGGKIEAQV